MELRSDFNVMSDISGRGGGGTAERALLNSALEH